MKNIFLVIIGYFVLSSVAMADPKIKECVCLDKSSPSLTWKAFKFSGKTAVPGTFKNIRYNVADNAKTLEALLKTISFEVDTSSVSTANPVRDETLKNYFFSKFRPIITGKIQSVTKNEISVLFSINNVAKKIVFSYTLDGSLNFKANSKIELINFGLKEAHESIHSACLALHTGEDGISKTWSDVDLEIAGRFLDNCKC